MITMEAATPTQAAIRALDALIRPPPDRVRLMCPVCQASGRIRVDPARVRSMASAGGGVMQLQVQAGEICDHAFTVHVDAHLCARCAYQ